MIPYKRHDLVWLSDAGKDYALHNIQNCIPPVSDREISSLILCAVPIPAIVRRQECAEQKLLCIGFSFPRIIEGVRLRIGSKVPLDCVVKHKTPFDVVKCEKRLSPVYEILKALADAGSRHNIQIGCFGSAALRLVTGLPYWQENSDMDIYLRHQGNRRDLELFFARLSEYEEKFGIIIDAEIEYPGQYGVKLKELFGPGNTVMGKGLYDVTLFDKKYENFC